MSKNKILTPESESGVVSDTRPDIFGYHDYREFLKDWFEYLKTMQPGFSLRMLAKQAQMASGYLPMVLAGKRPLSAKGLAKLTSVLGFTRAERSYFESLLALGTSDTQEVRLEALERMKRFRSYQALNPRELEVYRYLSRWQHVAIREMAALSDFKPDPEWIQARLRSRVPLKEVKEALEFLVGNGYLESQPDGSVTLPEKNLDCLGGVYRVALTSFHQEMFQLASNSIENTPSEERSILGHTVALDANGFAEAQEILKQAFERIRAIEVANSRSETVYHAELALFPLTLKNGNPAKRRDSK